MKIHELKMGEMSCVLWWTDMSGLSPASLTMFPASSHRSSGKELKNGWKQKWHISFMGCHILDTLGKLSAICSKVLCQLIEQSLNYGTFLYEWLQEKKTCVKKNWNLLLSFLLFMELQLSSNLYRSSMLIHLHTAFETKYNSRVCKESSFPSVVILQVFGESFVHTKLLVYYTQNTKLKIIFVFVFCMMNIFSSQNLK